MVPESSGNYHAFSPVFFMRKIRNALVLSGFHPRSLLLSRRIPALLRTLALHFPLRRCVGQSQALANRYCCPQMHRHFLILMQNALRGTRFRSPLNSDVEQIPGKFHRGRYSQNSGHWSF